ncbi:hypothetical protein N7495_001626 [Penicillium taxi]|uniref:uncharacterized protein n=1 Tax=Penicillium taxi TaxID=168475 RepID=UPI0025459B52|nr:uncharacterized protein N7495_001626 [Penicillium taxi]KAJ5908944.1 hypothetical protein N7495_001626 [Penicillium taxi]
MYFSLKTLGLIFIFAIVTSASSKFASSCENINGFGTILHADCQVTEDGTLQQTTLDLNRCLRNSKGKLKI